MATLQVRIDDQTKQNAAKIFDQLGIDMSSAIKLFLRQVIIKKGIPFMLITKNGLTTEQEDGIITAALEAKDNLNITKKMNSNDAIEFLKGIDGNTVS